MKCSNDPTNQCVDITGWEDYRFGLTCSDLVSRGECAYGEMLADISYIGTNSITHTEACCACGRKCQSSVTNPSLCSMDGYQW